MRFLVWTSVGIGFVAITTFLAWNMTCKPYESTPKKQPNSAALDSSIDATDNPEPSKNDQAAADNNPRPWCAAIEGPEWWLLLVGALTGVAIAYQAKEMTSATKVMSAQGALMKRQADLMETQIVIPYRAYLAVGEVTLLEESNTACIQIKNLGQVSAHVTSIEIQCVIHLLPPWEVMYTQPWEESYRHTISTPTDVLVTRAQGSAGSFNLNVHLPSAPDGRHSISISGIINYQIGILSGEDQVIRDTDMLVFTRLYNGYIAQWISGGQIEEITMPAYDETDLKQS